MTRGMTARPTHLAVDRSRNPLGRRPPLNHVLFDENKACFMAPWPTTGVFKPVRGLKPLLADCFWPDYDYEAAERVAKDLALGVVERHATSTGGRAAAGMHRGSFVHKQIEDFVKLSPKAFAEVHPKLHPFAATLLRAIYYDMKLTLVDTEVPVMCATGWFATAADLVAVDQQGQLVILEIKTGMANYFRHANKPMRGRALTNPRLPNSPMNQAFVQLLITSMMIDKQYNTHVHAAYVLHATEEGVDRRPVPAYLLERRERLYVELCVKARTDQERGRKPRRKIKKKPRVRRRALL